jgi:D-sedoheptulose 7-phosphate isomerase
VGSERREGYGGVHEHTIGRFSMVSEFARMFLEEGRQLLAALDCSALEALAEALAEVRKRGGRLFVLGVGGSAAHATHAVGDFRKLCGLEAYAPADNVAELTARTNDEGWETVFTGFLEVSRLGPADAILIYSVGGGSRENNISVNLVGAIDLARRRGARVFGIVGRDGGYTAEHADVCVVIPPLFPARVTPHTEGICAVLWHLLVSHPALQKERCKWEGASE